MGTSLRLRTQQRVGTDGFPNMATTKLAWSRTLGSRGSAQVHRRRGILNDWPKLPLKHS